MKVDTTHAGVINFDLQQWRYDMAKQPGYTERQAARLLDRIDSDKAKSHESLRRMFEHVTDHNASRLTYLDGLIDASARELRAIVARRTRGSA